MKCKHLKLIMELIFIFVLPFVFLLPCVSVNNEFIYDNNGNYESSNKEIFFDNPFEYTKTITISTEDYITTDLSYFYDSNSNSLSINENQIIYSNYSSLWSFDGKDYYEIVIDDEMNKIYFLDDGLPSLSFSILLTSNQEYSYIIIINTDIFNIDFDNYTDLDFPNGNFNDIVIFAESTETTTTNTIMGNIKLLFTNYLDFNDSIVLDLFIAYNTLWLMMFIIWHFLYSIFDFIVHLVDKERRRE